MPSITLRLTIRTLTESRTFLREIERAEPPAIDEFIPDEVSPECEGVVVLAVETDPKTGAVVCIVQDWDEPLPEHRAASFEFVEPELRYLQEGGWRQVDDEPAAG